MCIRDRFGFDFDPTESEILLYHSNSSCSDVYKRQVFKWVGKAAHGLRFISLRYFNAAGAHVSGKIGEAHNPESHLIPLIL